jgi:hypothetical protein
MSGVLLKPAMDNSYIFKGVLRDRCIYGGFKEECCLFDTGAAYCHMSLHMWKDLGFAEYMLRTKTELFQGIGVELPGVDGLTLGNGLDKKSNIPCEFVYSTVGDGRQIPAFEFVLDWLEFRDVKYPDVTVRVIESTDKFFIVGRNVLMPGTFTWTPDSPGETDGKFYLEFGSNHLQAYKTLNDKQSKFLYLDNGMG